MAIGVALVIVGALSIQFGASVATSLMPVLGLWFVLLCRYAVMGLMHVTLSLRHVQKVPRRDLRWGLVVALPLLGMNTAIYFAFSHIGVGLAVTIELLGPLALAIATSTLRFGWAYSLLALVGLVLAAGPTTGGDPVGVLWALLAAALWAAYLVAAKAVGKRLPGLVPLAVSSLVGLAVLIPINAALTDFSHLTLPLLMIGVGAGLLSSALPYATDLLALRRLPMSVAANLMSLHPVAASIFGALVLGERFTAREVAGLVIICAANSLVVSAAARVQRSASVRHAAAGASFATEPGASDEALLILDQHPHENEEHR